MSFRTEFEARMPASMSLPPELGALFEWCEAQGFVDQRGDAIIASLHDWRKVRAAWTRGGRPGGTVIEFSLGESGRDWAPAADPALPERLWVFAKTGGDGSVAAFWIDDEGRQVIVHLGSGSGSTLCCVLAETALDFVRLLAIGYDEIAWEEALRHRPNEEPGGDFLVAPNDTLRSWVTDTFATTIPERGTEIVSHLALYGDTASPDRFCRWIESVQAPGRAEVEQQHRDKMEARRRRRDVLARELVAAFSGTMPDADGASFDAVCPNCDLETTLRVTVHEGTRFALCYRCYFDVW